MADRIIHTYNYPGGRKMVVIQEGDVAEADIYGIKVRSTRHSVSWIGKAQRVTFYDQAVLGFRGLDTCLLVYKIHPTGLTLINADTSVPRYQSWHSLLSGNSIFSDCLRQTGWMIVLDKGRS